MPRLPPNQVPGYRRHRRSGQAVVSLDGGDYYLGPHGTQVSKDEYDRLTGIWKANGRRMPVNDDATANLTVIEVMAPYWQHARAYCLKNGEPTSEVGNIRLALRPGEAPLRGHCRNRLRAGGAEGRTRDDGRIGTHPQVHQPAH